ncbi:DUF2567 domain-containing protein [Nakamurella sp. YIM 132087]|uniref:DUF2567 domain-containing protein n=1 Tax=Nakamurella alba TaxID=2665158 RepID=A0A7K1FTR1_9ACTN|nr:DUF2567 domain-containing protein [Nakamurella alba]MTD17518.1 DUF2567 domain-containing protein [Nakamurella alba]
MSAPDTTPILLAPEAGRRKLDPARELLHWRSGATVLVAAVLAGIVQALLWAMVAPGEQFVVYKDGSYLPLPTESPRQFTAVAIMLLLSVAAGAALAAAAWAWRSVRGTAMLLTVGFAGAVGALTAYLLGPVMTDGTDPASIGASAIDQLVTAEPTAGNAMVILLEPLIAIAVYTFLVAWHGEKDLGTGLPQPLPAVPQGPQTPEMVTFGPQGRP